MANKSTFLNTQGFLRIQGVKIYKALKPVPETRLPSILLQRSVPQGDPSLGESLAPCPAARVLPDRDRPCGMNCPVVQELSEVLWADFHH